MRWLNAARSPVAASALSGLVAFAFLFAAPAAHAQDEAEASAARIPYEPLWCPRNIFNLVRSLSESGIDVEPMRVLYIFGAPDESGEPLAIHPLSSRIAGQEWAFHVVLEYQGLILDPDFTPNSQVVSTEEYFARMWQAGPLSHHKQREALLLRSIPALDYLRGYDGNWEWYLNEDPDPAIAVGTWLGIDAAPDRTP